METKQYRVGKLPYYRAGILYPAGSVVEIPAQEQPSATWFEVDTGLPVKVAKRPGGAVDQLSEEESALLEKFRAEKAARSAPKAEAPKAPVAPPKGRASDKEPI